MPRRLWVAGLLGAACCFAAATNSTQAQNTDAEPRYGLERLTAGFQPDPHTVLLKSGGETEVSGLPETCLGYINAAQPDVSLIYENYPNLNLTFFVDGPSDTALLVNDPNGTWHCNDDTGGADGYQPAVTIQDPANGKYDIWVAEQAGGLYNDVRLMITEANGPDWGRQVARDGDEFGDDEGTFARDGECDDPRFGGEIENHRGHDATDCRNAAGGGGDSNGLGDDAGEYARDGECDDPRFGGTLDSHRGHDATDCGNASGSGPVARADPERTAPPGTTLVSTGTGFFVSARGHMLTNHHVIDGCNRVVMRLLGEAPVEAEIINANEDVDLALLKADTTPTVWASFREGRSLRQGDDVVVFGFPLTGMVSQQGNLTAGLITALSGLPQTAGGPDDLRLVQISAQIAPGNSGGPLMDRSGNIVGVIVSTLSTSAAAERVGGALPQNMNFAVRDSVAKSFLDTNNVDYKTNPVKTAESVADIGERARKFTGLIECYQ
ncbi:MAG: serine protease [Proteobacteria bacterium]|nr:serine protease [Pseudomonadota bacterium]MDA1057325.1 serine protease [Pseudomonadota bacterium]